MYSQPDIELEQINDDENEQNVPNNSQNIKNYKLSGITSRSSNSMTEDAKNRNTPETSNLSHDGEISSEFTSASSEYIKESYLPKKDKGKERKEMADYECGEPFRTQYFTIDFTPRTGIDDNEELIKRCNEFWEFVRAEPMLKNMMVEPNNSTPYKEYKHATNTDASKETIKEIKIEEKIKKTAVEWNKDLNLDFLEKEPICGHYPESAPICKHNGETESEILTEFSGSTKHKAFKDVKKTTMSGSSSKSTDSRQRHIKAEELKDLCRQMEEFDLKHPKIFDPPKRSPALITAELQRLPQENTPIGCDCEPALP